eukprot:m51a1_g9635 hypothetical protein (273) ;mRNA; r:1151171-1152252
MTTTQLSNGHHIPLAKGVVTTAIRAGYRHIDCAPVYGNEKEVGEGIEEAIRSGTVRREDLWVTSKVWVTELREKDVATACCKTLGDLGLSYLDLYLIHFPVAIKRGVSYPFKKEDLDGVPIAETWRAMERLVDEGLVRSIGVANYSVAHLRDLLAVARIRPAVDQVEAHVLLQQPKLREFACQENIHLTSYSTLGNPGSSFRPTVLLKWALQSGFSVIPKSVSPSRIAENFHTVDLHLSEEDMADLAKLNRNARMMGVGFISGLTESEIWKE